MNDDFTGYDILNEGERDNERLDATAIEFAYSAPGERVHPEGIDPTPFLRRENQGTLPSCTGHMVTTGAESIAGLQVGSFESVPQLSRKFAWENGQKRWRGAVDWRQGCTIADVIEGLIHDGIPPESVAPYEFENGTSLTPAAYAAAKAIRAQNQVTIKDVDQAADFLDAGFGFIGLGVLLQRRGSAFWNCRGRLAVADVTENGGSSGHAMVLVGLTKDGRFRMPNSWPNWGDQYGCATVDPEAVRYWLSRPYTVMRGVTDLTGFDKVRLLTKSKGMG